jgi:hypothetical protein
VIGGHPVRELQQLFDSSFEVGERSIFPEFD